MFLCSDNPSTCSLADVCAAAVLVLVLMFVYKITEMFTIQFVFDVKTPLDFGPCLDNATLYIIWQVPLKAILETFH